MVTTEAGGYQGKRLLGDHVSTGVGKAASAVAAVAVGLLILKCRSVGLEKGTKHLNTKRTKLVVAATAIAVAVPAIRPTKANSRRSSVK